MIDEQQTRYDRTTVGLHWGTAVLIAGLWVVGQTADYLPKGSFLKSMIWSSHVACGFLLAIVIAVRIYWRSSIGRGLPAADSGLLHVLAKATHYLLYLLILVTVALGVANAFIRGYDMYHLVKLPQLGDKDWKRPVTEWHELAANLVMIVALFHAAAALFHHYVWHDGLLTRMSLRRSG